MLDFCRYGDRVIREEARGRGRERGEGERDSTEELVGWRLSRNFIFGV